MAKKKLQPHQLKDGWHIYQDTAGEYRWRLVRKGNIMAEGEGHARPSKALRALVGVKKFVASLTTVMNDKTRERTVVK